MLYLTRKIGESIVIDDTIELTVVETKGRTVKLGFTFPKHTTILRKELHEKITAQNLEAARGVETGVDLNTLLPRTPIQPARDKNEEDSTN